MSARTSIPALSDYQEYPPSQELADHFICLWTQGEHTHRVVPDGYIDIVCIADEPPSVVGPWTEPFAITFAPGTRITGARLLHGHAPGVLGIPAAELLNRSALLSAVWNGKRTAPFVQVAEERDAVARRLALSKVLVRSIDSVGPPDETVVAGMRWLARHPHGRVEDFSHLISIGERQLHRRFCAGLGYGPKDVSVSASIPAAPAFRRERVRSGLAS